MIRALKPKLVDRQVHRLGIEGTTMESYRSGNGGATRINVELIRQWRERTWARSIERQRYEALPGRVIGPLPPTWHYWMTLGFVNRISDQTAQAAEEVIHGMLVRLAKETGTHFAAHYAVAATMSGKAHVHAAIGADPGAQHTKGLLEIMKPRRRLGPRPKRSVQIASTRRVPEAEVDTIEYLAELLIAQTDDTWLRPMNGGLQVDAYFEEGWATGGVTHRRSETGGLEVVERDLDASAYMAAQRERFGYQPLHGLAAYCPGRFARHRGCRRGACSLGLEKL